ncbi:MAG: hypothetical protein K2X71_09395 [Methylobacterium sp.]|uniref:2-keto-4-pentenoate hydratase n=1 Tax=Methylobacterium sp. TaxID=409 RepID=UPI00258E3132|nr:hypothetical protein [Methylobacterium sp.]MBY0296237.1 hypothetical protein [Methylobacterium sp.]
MRRDPGERGQRTARPTTAGERYDPENLGRRLAEARALGLVMPDLDLRVVDGPAADAVQAEAVLAYDQPIRGYTLAATADHTARLLGCDGPIVAPLFAGAVLPDGAALTLPRGILGVGAQYTFVFGRPFPLDGEDSGDLAALADAILSCSISLQVLGRRVRHATPLDTWTAIADFGLDAAHVRGDTVGTWRVVDLAAAPVALALDGHVAARGSGREILNRHPLAAAAWLAETLARSGRSIDAGDAVATGSCTGLSQLVPGQRVEADFGVLGRVTLHTR